MNDYVVKDSQEYLWIAKRSQLKPTFQGMLDDLVAGGLVCIDNSVHCSYAWSSSKLQKCKIISVSSPVLPFQIMFVLPFSCRTFWFYLFLHGCGIVLGFLILCLTMTLLRPGLGEPCLLECPLFLVQI